MEAGSRKRMVLGSVVIDLDNWQRDAQSRLTGLVGENRFEREPSAKGWKWIQNY